MIKKDDYCIHVCGGKCCIHPTDHISCIYLKDGACSVYEERYSEGHPEEELIFFYTIGGPPKPFYCGKIEKLIEKKQLSPEVEAQCCYAHEELLLKDYEIPIR